MFRALLFKELRETAGIAAMASIAYLAVIAFEVGFNIFGFSINRGIEPIPFLTDAFMPWFVSISILFAAGLAFWQTITENTRGTWLFLLHRPIRSWQLVAAKLAVGAGLYLVVSAVAILIYAIWAAVPGTHASPFYWWMTTTAWQAWFIVLFCYFGVFLVGIRPGRWVGTRVLPAVAAGLIAMFCGGLTFGARWQITGLSVCLLCLAVFVGSILYVTRTRDYS
jgi:ABC-type transport system involved in multi-copper enzyme maturation permease subunit